MYKQLNFYRPFIFFLLLFCFSKVSSQVDSPERYEVDIKREEMEFNPYSASSNEVMLRAREFIRKDPTYYVGYMMEGLYRYERAGDADGYVNASKPLKRALELFENDYSFVLKDAFSSAESHEKYMERIFDYVITTDRLMDCYSHTERPDSVIWLLNRYKSWNFQHDYLGADNYIAWTYHRNRFYTSEKYDFLYNSIEENEMAALHFLHQNLENIDKNAAKNEEVMHYMRIVNAKQSAYHYLSLVYSYLKKQDTARMYYDLMRPYSRFPYNNYAIFCFVNGTFDESYPYFRYSLSRNTDGNRYFLKEAVYYMSMMDVMRANPKKGIDDVSLHIKQTGIRPGWGWYNMGLGRAFMYNGQLDSSMVCIEKAGKFNDIHIGTTWGQSHYAFSNSVLKLMNLQRQEALIKFDDKLYWLSPAKLARIAEIRLEAYATKMLIFSQLSSNPERDEVYYNLFSSEATVSFDEIFHTLKDYGRSYFINEFEKRYETDERDIIRKYFKLFQGKLYLEKGNTRKALKALEEAYDKGNDGSEFEKLYNARLFEALTIANEASGTTSNFEKFRNQFYQIYPQLVPFSQVKMKFKLQVETEGVESSKQILADMQSFNVDFVKGEIDVPIVKLSFGKTGEKDVVYYSVESSWGTVIIEPSTIIYSGTNTKGVAKKLVYALFSMKE